MCFPGCDHKLDNVVFRFNTDKALLPLTSVNTVSFFFFFFKSLKPAAVYAGVLLRKGFTQLKSPKSDEQKYVEYSLQRNTILPQTATRCDAFFPRESALLIQTGLQASTVCVNI